jgi:hypothetical protein
MFDWTKNMMITSVEGAVALIANAVIRIQHGRLSVEQDSAILNIVELFGRDNDEVEYSIIIDRYNKIKSSNDVNNIDFYVRSLSYYSHDFRIRILNSIVDVLMIENNITDIENEDLIYRIAGGLGIFGWSVDCSSQAVTQ